MFNLRKSTSDVQKLSLRNDAMEPGSADNGKVSDQTAQISKEIKDRIRGSRLCNILFKEFGVSMDQLDNLQIIIEDLDGKYAECDENTMKLNTMMFEKGNFFEDYFYVILHEICHYLTRVVEGRGLFFDPEESYGMVAAIAYQMEQGNGLDEIWNKLFNKVSWHFNDELKAKEVFEKMIEEAKILLNK